MIPIGLSQSALDGFGRILPRKTVIEFTRRHQNRGGFRAHKMKEYKEFEEEEEKEEQWLGSFASAVILVLLELLNS